MKLADLVAWFAGRGWKPFAFQREVWKAIGDGRSGMLHATTGAGKTYAVWLGALKAFATAPRPAARATAKKVAPPLTVLWITPMRALASDTLRALQQPLDVLAPDWSAGARSGDTSSGERSVQNARLPTVLVTTPESLSVLLSRADAAEVLGTVKMVVVDEWHELLGNKRGVQVQLALARLKRWNAALCVWGMSATLGNLDEAMRTLLGREDGTLVQGQVPKKLVIDSLLPGRAERFPWGGHLGLTMLPQVVDEIASSSTTLVFTNTRSQSEIWYQAILEAKPEWAGLIALHHGSLDRAVREWVEAGLKSGALRAVVCTSSLDLGVDFLPVERVLQIGSPKGVARLLQRAGRSGHAPGRPSRITLVPTHSIEMVEGAAARDAIAAGHIEARSTPEQPLDVLVQHLVTVALGGGFVPDDLYDEVRGTAAYAKLSRDSWDWCLSFVRQGGPSLAAYPDYQRAVPDADGVWRVPDARLARRHRMNIGTIVSDVSMAVQYVGGAKIGSVEESFAARMKPGDCFLFGGRLLELVRIREMTAWVRRASGKRAAVPRWNGGRMPLSTTLADAVVQQLALAGEGRYDTPELQCVRPLLEIQQQWSALPTPQTLLAEVLKTREGWHLFLYPFAGRHVHLGLANLIAWRVAQHAPRTFSIAVNDYGFELLCATEVDWPVLLPQVLRAGHDAEAQDAIAHHDADAALLHEVLESLNASELAQRRFREIARVSGLIFQGYPGEKRSNKQLQASSSLFWEVFRKYDPANRLLLQAEQELLAQELEIGRLRTSLTRMNAQALVVQTLARPTPFAFPLMVERFREKLSNESVADRIARMVEQLEKAAGGAVPVGGVDEVKAGMAFGQEGGGGRGGAQPSPQRPRRERKPSRPLPPL
ncbi:ligase-associated DNA damage response DEXH box helicase [Variovorax arabinosiphilus]|uniref:ligase-associated DNA damage response DEXH box helicase n=1 Tax=Variovorax arabinosiphilus TaxID=3053498 RepID=UPI002578C483|nr:MULTISPECIES: ligase-associated DNA damage response DEXH box helicase [unclassified Variovorax]MDM0121134.1 ligase-associated DNA damage response DEXH box helicase [Variovorax sp. J2L1-78]MDM0130195.1 ligase-associated DNA damage response DEXH box helicase [Variovorax sp. J2L1-63]MDM0233897.1 ligase-associated DNA damage response DEXH box helicase [Variovorax sp. J2R1-6]